MRVALTVPELPEVETLCRGLAARITGMHITAAEILDRKIFDGPEDVIMQDIEGYQISRVERRGKVLILFLRESGSAAGESGSLLIHPKMTGQLVLTSDGITVFAGGHPSPSMLRPMPNATTRAVFRVGPSCRLYYNAARRSRTSSARRSPAAAPASPATSTRPAAARATSARRTCSAGRACPATCAAPRSSAP